MQKNKTYQDKGIKTYPCKGIKKMRMIQVEERYISLLTDFGFKRIFWNSNKQGFADLFSQQFV